VAYANPSPQLLLNVRAASMGLFAGKPQGFLDFAQRADAAVSGTDFLPRWRYGDYLEEEVRRAIAHGNARGHDVQCLPLRADALVPEADGVTVICGDDTRRVDAAVLAVGSLPPRPLPMVTPAALASGHYVVDPWPLLANPPAQAPDTVIVIGMGLTAIDVVIDLAARWPHTQFTALSRHGKWPEPHLRTMAVPRGDSAELVQAMHDDPDVLRWMRLIREAMAPEEDWRGVFDSLRPHISTLWACLPDAQRARFLRHAHWAWERARHRMPVPVVAGLTALEDAGRLTHQPGRVRAVDADPDGATLALTLQPRGDTAPHTLYAGLVVQATGMAFDARHTAHPLLRQMVLNRHVVPDPLGLGLSATPDCRLRHPDGTWPRLFALGSLLRGTLWESTAMPEIRQQARVVADQLLAD
jgi:uncharacterized NAD(P)/FAD-binding protein YdhS